jgi:hypothetical protein
VIKWPRNPRQVCGIPEGEARGNSANLPRVKAHTDQVRIGNATRIFSFQKQIKPSTDKNFTKICRPNS